MSGKWLRARTMFSLLRYLKLSLIISALSKLRRLSMHDYEIQSIVARLQGFSRYCPVVYTGIFIRVTIAYDALTSILVYSN